MSVFFQIGLLLRLRMWRAAQPAEVALDFAVKIVRHIAVTLRLAHIAAEPRNGGPARRPAEFRDEADDQEHQAQHHREGEWGEQGGRLNFLQSAPKPALYRRGPGQCSSVALVAGIQG